MPVDHFARGVDYTVGFETRPLGDEIADLLAEGQPAFNGRNMKLTDVAGEWVPQITGTPKKA